MLLYHRKIFLVTVVPWRIVAIWIIYIGLGILGMGIGIILGGLLMLSI